jgi:putative glutamine amidotransferase
MNACRHRENENNKPMTSKKQPVVLVCGNRVGDFHGTPAHVVRDTYVQSLLKISGALPVFIPVAGAAFDARQVIDRFDGILLTGSNAHLNPSRYGSAQEFPDEDIDNFRDHTSLETLTAALERDMPVFAICRGMQELNVIQGGTLHQNLHMLPGRRDHRHSRRLTMIENFENRAHTVSTQKGGLFQAWGLPPEFHVNSLHAQGIDRLGRGLHVECISDDGLIEAVSMPGKRFVLATQWHPEGDSFVNPASHRLFEEFGKVLAARI